MDFPRTFHGVWLAFGDNEAPPLWGRHNRTTDNVNQIQVCFKVLPGINERLYLSRCIIIVIQQFRIELRAIDACIA